MNYLKVIKNYIPYNEQEEKEKEQILQYSRLTPDLLTRDNTIAHFTASSVVVNESRDKILMVYHNIWQDWCWTGGHVDGEEDFLKVAIRETKEETGVKKVIALGDTPIALDIVPAWGHYKNGKYVVSHQHLNLTYLLQVDEGEILHKKEDENQGVMWIPIKDYKQYVKQKSMYPIYDKIIEKMINNRI
ncbi:MAG: NUDIX hydrolase [Clostridia bacterium]|nr:NUDIX hydrolase [Clostridia bacterium]